MLMKHIVNNTYLPAFPIFDFQNFQKLRSPDFLEYQLENISVFVATAS